MIAELYGPWGGQTKLAAALGTESRTVRRWLRGDAPMPGPAIAAVECLLREKRRIGGCLKG